MFPRFSVVIPNYNHANYLSATLDAIFSQSLQPSEVVIVDDASTDNSIEVIQSYSRRFSNLRLVQNSVNLGAVETCNRAFVEAKFDYVHAMAADDYPLPGHFERSMRMLVAYPNAAFCTSTPGILLKGKSNPEAMDLFSKVRSPRYFSPVEVETLVRGIFIPGTTTMMRRDALMATGLCTKEHKWHSDWFFLLVMAFRHGICVLPDMGAVIRHQDTSYSSTGMRNQQEQEEVIASLVRSVTSPKFSDVLPFFARSRAFSHFKHQLVSSITSRPELWTAEILMLTGQFLWEDCQAYYGQQLGQNTIHANKDSAHVSAEMYTQLSNTRRLIAANQIQSALDALFQLINTFPHFAEAYVTAARVLADAGQIDLAYSILHAAKQALHYRPEILTELAAICLRKNDFSGAKEFLRQSLSLDPTSISAQAALEKLESN